MKTDKAREREREVVRRILLALEELPLQQRGKILYRLAALYGRPRYPQDAPAQTDAPKGPSKEGSFSMAQIAVLSSEELADAA